MEFEAFTNKFILFSNEMRKRANNANSNCCVKLNKLFAKYFYSNFFLCKHILEDYVYLYCINKYILLIKNYEKFSTPPPSDLAKAERAKKRINWIML